MGPKNCTGVPPKDLSWVDRMYMKFETMCVEVDRNPSLLLQETSKYVESQVNAVGANVKKLCTELIQDLISGPVLSSEGAEKKLECALHCKCHCMDSEKPKLIDTDTAGFEGGNDTINVNAFQKQDTLKKEVSKVEMLNTTTESQNPKNSRACGQEFNIIHGQEETRDGEIFDRDLGSPSSVDASYAKCKYERAFSAKDLQAEEVKRVVGGFWPMYSHHFSELSRSTEEEEGPAVIVSDRDSEKDARDEEQSARWFLGEDVRKELEPDIFLSESEKPRHGEPADLDWELL